MDLRRWLLVAVCFCIFTGCKSAQSPYDYCGPMPDEGGDFMYRKNSVLGGDPTMKRMDQEAPDEQGNEGEQSGPEPTPAPPPDQEPRPDMDDMEEDQPTLGPETAPGEAAIEAGDDEFAVGDEGADSDSEDELEGSPSDVEEEIADGQRSRRRPSQSTTEWHAPSKKSPSPIRQVRFRAD